MKKIRCRWHVALFTAVMFFAAGISMAPGQEYLNEAIMAMAATEGVALLGIALTGMAFNGALFCWSTAVSGKAGTVMAFFALWVKAVLLGMFCGAAFYEFSASKTVILLLSLLGGGCICAAYVMDGNEDRERAKKTALWLCGAAIEGIIVPSAARTIALLLN